MAEIKDLSTTDASNTARFPEGMARATLNNSARALEGMIARHDKDAVEGNVDSTGSANAYVVAANRTITAYYDGMRQCFHASFANTGAATLNVDSVGAKTIKKHHDQDLASGDIEQHQFVEVVYSASDDTFQMLSQLGNAPTVTGGDGITVTANDIDFAPAELSDVALAADDQVVIADASDTNLPKTATAADFQTLFAAAASDQETATAVDKNVTPGVQHRHPSAAKCWGYVTVSGGTPTLAANYNVTSIADTDVGRMTVTIATDFSSANYAVVALTSGATTAGRNALEQIGSRAAGAFEIVNTNEAATASDPDAYSFAAYGDQS